MEGTREKLIAIIEEARREAVGTVGSMNNGFAVWYADKLLAAGVAPVQGWIPVTERLPEPKADVLCCIHYKDGRTGVNQGWYSALNEQWYIGVAGIHAPVTHWMPLPDAPEEYRDAES